MVTDVQRTPEFETALTWKDQVSALTIVDQSTYDLAATLKAGLAKLRKEVVAKYAGAKADANRAHKSACALEATDLVPVTEAESLLVQKIRDFQRQQEEIRAAAQREVDRLQREKDEADRQRRLAEAEVIRQEELAKQTLLKAQEEETRLTLALGAPTPAASEAILSQPVFAVPEVAPVEMYMEPAAYTPPVIVAPTFDRQKGLGIRDTWEAQVTNMRLLARAVADGTIPESYIEITPALKARVRADKQLTNIPGVRAVQK